MRSLTTIGIEEDVNIMINNLKNKFNVKNKNLIIKALLNSYDSNKLEKELENNNP